MDNNRRNFLKGLAITPALAILPGSIAALQVKELIKRQDEQVRAEMLAQDSKSDEIKKASQYLDEHDTAGYMQWEKNIRWDYDKEKKEMVRTEDAVMGESETVITVTGDGNSFLLVGDTVTIGGDPTVYKVTKLTIGNNYQKAIIRRQRINKTLPASYIKKMNTWQSKNYGSRQRNHKF